MSLRKLKIELPSESAIPFLGIYPKKLTTVFQIFVHPVLWAEMCLPVSHSYLKVVMCLQLEIGSGKRELRLKEIIAGGL